MIKLSDINFQKDIYPFLKDKEGKYRTLSLFPETNLDPKKRLAYPPIYTLKNYDFEWRGKLLASIKLLYLSYDHVPGFEYEFANTCFGCWEHWTKITDSGVLKPYVDAWRHELETNLQQRVLRLWLLLQ